MFLEHQLDLFGKLAYVSIKKRLYHNVNSNPAIIITFADLNTIYVPGHSDLYYVVTSAIFQGRNDFAIFVMTRELGILTWDEAFLSLRSTLLPDALRAKYCELIIGNVIS